MFWNKIKWNDYDKIEKLANDVIQELKERKRLIDSGVSSKHCEFGLDEMLKTLKKEIK